MEVVGSLTKGAWARIAGTSRVQALAGLDSFSCVFVKVPELQNPKPSAINPKPLRVDKGVENGVWSSEKCSNHLPPIIKLP